MQLYNITGYDKLQILTGLSKYEIYEVAVNLGIEVHYNTFSKWMSDGSTPPRHLITLCNHFMYPISNFSRTKGVDTQDRIYRLFKKEEWENLCLCTSRFSDYTTKVEHQKREKAIERIGCSDGYYDSLRKYPEVSLPVKLTFADLLMYTNNTKMYAGDIIVDHNEFFPFEEGICPFYDHKAMDAYYEIYPRMEARYISDELYDTLSFFTQYIQHGHFEGDDKIVAIRIRSLNEIASVISKITDENQQLREKLDAAKDNMEGLASENQKLMASNHRLTTKKNNEKE